MLYSNNADMAAMRGGKSINKITLCAALLVFGSAPADAGYVQDPLLPPSAPRLHQKVWVKVITRSTLREIARDLHLSNTDLTALNDKSPNDTIQAGTWIAIPYESQVNLAVATRVSRKEVSFRPPIQTPPARQNETLPTAGHVQAPFLLASAPATQSRLWVMVSTRSTLQEIAADLGLSNSDLTALNDQASQDTINPGGWIVIPADAEESLASATRLDGTTVLRKAPLQTPPARQSVVRIRANESLSTFSRDQGVSLSELRSLNPGLDLARLAIGSEVRVAKASPRALLAIRPTVSGGASFPALPALPASSPSAIGPDTAQKQAIRQRLRKAREQESLVALRKAEARRRRYRTIGSCTFDWQSWGRSNSGVRSVKSSCQGYLRPVTEVAVDCKRLKVSEMKYRKWYGWKIPSGDLEALTVEACANVVGAPNPVYVKPDTRTIEASTTTDIKSTKCTGPAILCGMP